MIELMSFVTGSGDAQSVANNITAGDFTTIVFPQMIFNVLDTFQVKLSEAYLRRGDGLMQIFLFLLLYGVHLISFYSRQSPRAEVYSTCGDLNPLGRMFSVSASKSGVEPARSEPFPGEPLLSLAMLQVAPAQVIVLNL